MAYVDPDPYTTHPIRKYKELLGRGYTDTSKLLRYYLRSLWWKGQQLWDDDTNSAFAWWSTWMPRPVTFRRDLKTQRPNYYEGPYPTYIMDKNHWVNPDPNNVDCVLLTSPISSTVLRATQGQLVFVKADRMFVAKWNTADGDGWRAAFRLPDNRRNHEWSCFISKGVANQIAHSHVVATKWTLFKDNDDCRFHTWDYQKPPLLLLKNGVQVATIYKAYYSSGCAVPADVTFNIGDILEIKMPAVGGSALAITLVGGLA